MRSIILYGLFIVLICSILTRLSEATDDDYDLDENYPYENYPDDLDDTYPIYPDDNSQFTGEDEYKTGTIISASDVKENKTIVVNDGEKEIISTIEENHENVTEKIASAISEPDVNYNKTVEHVIEEEKNSKTDEIFEIKTEAVRSEITGHIEIVEDDVCSKCSCDQQLQFIDCSNRSLMEIPKNLPNTSLLINLSNNSIVEIDENAFSILTELRQLKLGNNNIQNINHNVFKSLAVLDHLDLSTNNISKIDPDLFSHSERLKQLDLNGNPIAFEANQVFLNLPSLEILNLVGCNISELYNETFMNLTGLQSLNLANNSLSEDINVSAFHPLSDLLKLKIPLVSRTDTYGLCEKISVIDVISFDNYNISCYELISGSSYDESTITHGPPTTAETTTSMRSTSMQEITTTTETVVTTAGPLKENVTVSPKISDDISISTDALNTTKDENVNSTKVEISSQSIKTILIASIAVAVVGLIIGLICRKDLFGVKTKLCRTQRPEPVTIPEQVPLNKV